MHGDWETLGDVLHRIVRSSEPTSTAAAPDFDIIGYQDRTANPLIVHWGRAPGKEQAGEPSAAAKLNKLKEWFREAQVAGYLPVSEIDLRSMRLMQDSLQAAKTESIRLAEKSTVTPAMKGLKEPLEQAIAANPMPR